MRKNKEYSSDVQNKIVEHHIIESGCKKRVKALKIPISTIRIIIKRFYQLKMLKICLEEDVSIVLMHGEEESLRAKDSSRITAGEL